MLILERCEGESILIGDSIEVKIAKAKMTSTGIIKVKLGITAPSNISVYRKEILRRRNKMVVAASPEYPV